MARRIWLRLSIENYSKRHAGKVNSVNNWVVQCGRCFKWRSIETQERFEDIICKFVEDPAHQGRKS
ncbi:hypothetical protein Leryth_023639 [Lithospermum erythrorhizon]|nr:hypothetical protein Leryth_023639 [Lithospermum erythrorhizon]